MSDQTHEDSSRRCTKSTKHCVSFLWAVRKGLVLMNPCQAGQYRTMPSCQVCRHYGPRQGFICKCASTCEQTIMRSLMQTFQHCPATRKGWLSYNRSVQDPVVELRCNPHALKTFANKSQNRSRLAVVRSYEKFSRSSHAQGTTSTLISVSAIPAIAEIRLDPWSVREALMQSLMKVPSLEYSQPGVRKLRDVMTMPNTPCVSCVVFCY